MSLQQWNRHTVSDHKTSSANFEPLGIGERLRNAREARGLSLAAMEQVTKVRATYLQALEDERYEALPEWIYVRGFIRAYAATLGINPSELLDVYDRAFGAPVGPILSGRAIEIPIRPAVPRSRLRRILGYIGVGLIVAVIILGYIGVQQVREFSRPVAQPPPPGVGPPTQPALPRPTPGTTVSAPTPAASTPQPTSPLEANSTAEIMLEVKASGRSWLRIIVDGSLLFEGFVTDGEVRTWSAHKQLTIRVGNMSVVALAVNGRPVPPRPPGSDTVWENTFTAGQ